MNLRERLIALADDVALVDLELKPGTIGHGDIKRIALAAARMALTDAMMDCAPPNAWDQEDCFNAITSLRDGLE